MRTNPPEHFKRRGGLGIAAEIDYTTDVNAIAQRGMLRTPAVIVDGEVVIQGHIPSPREAKDLLTKYNK